MAYQTLRGGVWFPRVPDLGMAGFTYAEYTLDAAGEKWGVVFAVPKTGNITKVGFRVATVSSSQTLRVGLETVSATDGLPTSTQYGGSAVGTQASPAASTGYSVTLGTQATATAGDVVAAVIQWDGATGNLGLSRFSTSWRSNFPYHVANSAGWAKQGGDYLALLWVEYDDGTTYPINAYPITALNSHDYNTGSTPDERAVAWLTPVPLRVTGAWWILGSTFANHDVVLYNGTTALATISADIDQIEQAGGSGLVYRSFATPQEIAAGTQLYLSMKPTTGTDIRARSFDVLSAAVLDSMDVGQAMHYAQRTDAGAWSATTTRRLFAGIVADQLSDGVGGGSTVVVPVAQPVFVGSGPMGAVAY